MGLLGLYEFYESLLNEAQSPEEIKKILTHLCKEKGVPEDVLDKILETDPTKKKSYTRWVLNQWANYKREILNSIKNGELKKMFEEARKKASATDGSSYNLIDHDFKDALDIVPGRDPIFSEVSDKPEEEDYDIVFDSPEWRIAVPHCYEADRKLGKGSGWCTAGAFGDDPYYWNKYSKWGPLWVNFRKNVEEIAPKDHKKYPYQRYQFLFEFENWSGQYCDVNDSPVRLKNLNIPEDVIQFYYSQNKNYGDICKGRDVKNAELNDFNDFRDEHKVTLKTLSDGEEISIKLGPSLQDWRAERYRYFVFSSRDETDPVGTTEDNNTVNPEDYNAGEIGQILDNFQNAIAVKLANGNINMYYLDDDSLEYTDVTNATFKQLSEKLILISKQTESGNIFYLYEDNEKLMSSKEIRGAGDLEIVNVNTLSDGSYAIDFASGDGNHALLAIQDNCIYGVLTKDNPANGKYYEIGEENGKYYTVGQHFKHWLFGVNGEVFNSRINAPETGEDFNGENCHVVKEIGESMYIVASDNERYNNIYDSQAKRFLSKTWFNRICDSSVDENLPNNILECMLDGDIFNIKKTIFDINTKRFLTPMLVQGRVGGSYFVGMTAEKKLVLYSFEAGKSYSLDGVEKITVPSSNISNNFIIVKSVDGSLYTWFFKENRLGLRNLNCTQLNTTPTAKYSTENGTTYLFLADVSNGQSNEKCLVDLEHDRVVIDKISGRINYSPNEQWVEIPYYQNGTNLYLILNGNGEVVVKDVKYCSTTNNYLVTLSQDGNKILCFDDNCELKSSLTLPRGIKGWNTNFHNDSILFEFADGSYVEFGISDNKVINAEGISPEEAQSRVASPEMQAIRENFKKLYNRYFND